MREPIRRGGSGSDGFRFGLRVSGRQVVADEQRIKLLDQFALRVDFAVVNTAPGEVELVDAALRRSHLVVVPVEPSPLSLTGLCDVAAGP